MRPGIIGGVNWGGGAFDPESGMLYAKVSDNQPALVRIVAAERSTTGPRAGEVDAEFVGSLGGTTFTPPAPAGEPEAPSPRCRFSSRRTASSSRSISGPATWLARAGW